MTGLIPEREFSRRSIVKGGALVVGFSLAGSAVAGKAARPSTRSSTRACRPGASSPRRARTTRTRLTRGSWSTPTTRSR